MAPPTDFLGPVLRRWSAERRRTNRRLPALEGLMVTEIIRRPATTASSAKALSLLVAFATVGLYAEFAMAQQAMRRRTDAPTRSLILAEVERLIARNGVYGFTLRDVATPLGVQVQAIYKHYADRDDVFCSVAYVGQP